MYYLKAIAQDLLGNGQADTVILHFYRQRVGRPDELIHDIVGQNMVAGARWGGRSQPDALDLDKRRIATFADSFLRLDWCNPSSHWRRTLVMYVDHFGKTGRPNAVKLDFRESTASAGDASLVCEAAAYDVDSDGVFETFTNSDVDRNGVADKVDKELIRALGASFLGLKWYAH
jgi:hypothetical protein